MWCLGKDKWEKERERVIALEKAIMKLGEVPSSIPKAYEYAVSFFNLVSAFQDEGMLLNAPGKMIQVQKELNDIVEYIGRSQYGVNRTQKGEKITLDNIYLGGIFGLCTFSARKWLESDSIYEGFASQWLVHPEKYEENPLDRKVIFDFQVKKLLKQEKILSLCEKLIAA